MLFKLLSLLAAGKGGAVAAAAIVAGATTVGVVTTPEVQDGFREVAAAVSGIVSPGMSGLAKLGKIHDDCEKGQPVVVAQRNAADKLLRDAYQSSHKELTGLRGGKDVDRQKANEILRGAEEELRGVLRTSLNEVAALTLGREGQLKDKDKTEGDEDETSPLPSASPTATPTASATLAPASPTSQAASETATPKPSCPPKASASASPAPAASPSGSPSSEERGRVAVASRVTLDPALAAIVEDAKVDMKTIVDDTKDQFSKLEPVERGKSGEKGKPEDKDKSEERGKDSERGKPSEKPSGRPSSAPGRP